MHTEVTVPIDLTRLPLNARVTLLRGGHGVVLVRRGGVQELPPLSGLGDRLRGMEVMLDGTPVHEAVVPRLLRPNSTFTIAGPHLSPTEAHPQTFTIDNLRESDRLDMATLAAGEVVTIVTTGGAQVKMCRTTNTEVQGGSLTAMMAPHPNKNAGSNPVNWVTPRILVPGTQLAIAGSPVGYIQSFAA